MPSAGLPLVMPALAMAGAHYRTRELSRVDMTWRSIGDSVRRRDRYTCLGCRFKALQRQQVHHRDHDHSNNSPLNLATSCCWCHAVQHPGFHGMEGRAFVLEIQIPDNMDEKGALALIAGTQKNLIRGVQRHLLEEGPVPVLSDLGLRRSETVSLVELANDFIAGRRRTCIERRAGGRVGFLMGFEPWAFEEDVKIWKSSGNFSVAS